MECIASLEDFVAGEIRPCIKALPNALFVFFALWRKELGSSLFFSNQERHFLSLETNNTFSEDGIFEQIFHVGSSIGNPDAIIVHQHIRLFFQLAMTKGTLPIIVNIHPLILPRLRLLFSIMFQVLVLNCQPLDVSPDEVDPGAVDDIVRVPITGDAFMDEFAIFFDHLLSHMHELVVFPLIFVEGRHETVLFELIDYGEHFGLGDRPVGGPREEVYPAD